MRANYDLTALNLAIVNYAREPGNELYQTALIDAVFTLKYYFYQNAKANAQARGKNPDDVGEDDYIGQVNEAIKRSVLTAYVTPVLRGQLESLYSERNSKYGSMYMTGVQEAAMEGLQKLPALMELIVCASEILKSQASRAPRILGGILLILAALSLAAFAALIAASLILGAPIAIPVVGAAVAAITALQSVSMAIPIAVAAVTAIGAVAGILNSAIAFQAARFQKTMGEVVAISLSNILRLFSPIGRDKSLRPINQPAPDVFPVPPPQVPLPPVALSGTLRVAEAPPPSPPPPPPTVISPLPVANRGRSLSSSSDVARAAARGRFATSPGNSDRVTSHPDLSGTSDTARTDTDVAVPVGGNEPRP